MRATLLISFATALAATSPPPALAQTLPTPDEICFDSSDSYSPEVQIAGCSTLIQFGGYTGTDLADIYFNRGIAYDRGDNDLAIDDYTQAIRLNPTLGDAFFNRAYVFARLGRHDRAIADYSEAIRLNPDAADAFKNRALSFGHLGQVDAAISDYDEAIRRDPSDARIYNRRGIKYFSKGEYSRALADFDQALRLKERADFFYDRGVALLRLGRTSEGQADIARAIKMNPNVAADEAQYGVKP